MAESKNSTGAVVKVYARTVTLATDEAPTDRNGHGLAADTTPTIHHTEQATTVATTVLMILASSGWPASKGGDPT